MILDLHIHSKYSFDSISKPHDIVRVAKRKGLNGIAITDHNTIKGGVEAKKINHAPGFLVIIGSEISTEIGDIIGLFLNEEIKSRDSMEVVEEIHQQGGIAILPHPYKDHRLNDEIVREIDAIEVFNARTSEENNKKAMKLAERFKKTIVAGSDAHFCSEIGTCKVILNSTNVRDEILNGKLKLETKMTPLYMQSISQMIKSIKLRKYNEVPIRFISLIMNILRGK